MSTASIDDVLIEVRELRRQVEALSSLAPVGRDFLTVAEAADRTGWKPATIRMWCRAGKLAATRIDGIRDAWEIPVSELAKLPRKRMRVSR